MGWGIIEPIHPIYSECFGAFVGRSLIQKPPGKLAVIENKFEFFILD